MNRLLRGLAGDDEIAAMFSDAAELGAMLRVEAELAEAQAREGLIATEAAERITAVCHRLLLPLAGEGVMRSMTDEGGSAIPQSLTSFGSTPSALIGPAPRGTFSRAAGEGFVLAFRELVAGMAKDGVIVPALVRQLKRAVGAPHDVAVHLGATSQDIVDTSLVLRLREVIAALEQRLEHLLAALAALPGDVPLMAHTRMQQALPFVSADKIATWTAPLVRHRARLAELKPRLLVLQLGGPIGNRASFEGRGDAIADRMARALGLACAPPWHTARDGMAEFGAWLSLVTGSLGKFGQDVALMAQNELGTVELPHGGGSSAMKHKSNPVGAEILVALARLTAGLLGTLHQALVHENERSGAAWTLEWMVLPQMAEGAGAALRIARALAETMRLRPRQS